MVLVIWSTNSLEEMRLFLCHYSMTDDLVYLINDHFAHHVDDTIHKCKVLQREEQKELTIPMLDGLTDDRTFELLDYYGGTEAMRIMERGREPERKSNIVDPLFCVCGKRHA